MNESRTPKSVTIDGAEAEGMLARFLELCDGRVSFGMNDVARFATYASHLADRLTAARIAEHLELERNADGSCAVCRMASPDHHSKCPYNAHTPMPNK